MTENLKSIRDRVLRKMRRKDVPASLVNQWIVDTHRRIQTTLRTPLDEAESIAVVPAGFTGRISVPGNLLNLTSITVDGFELQMRGVTEINHFLAMPASQARYFSRIAGNYVIAPRPQEGAKITIHYRADFANLVLDTDSTKLLKIAPELVMYGALILSADDSSDDVRLSKWNDMYNARFVEIQDMADRDELSNASIRLAYDSNGEW